MKNINKYVLLPVALATVCSSLIACKHTSSSVDITPNEDVHVNNNELYFEGTHNLDASDKDGYLVKNGHCDYSIVISENSSQTIKMARDEFVYLFKKATGCELNVVFDTDLTHSSNQKYISIGENNLFKSSGIVLDKLALGNDGIRIVTKDNNIYIVGGKESGTLYGVYDFMQILFHYEQFSNEVMYIDKNVTEVKMKTFDVTDIPDIPMRCHSYGFMGKGNGDYDKKMYGYRLRQDRVRNDHRMNIFKVLGDSKSDCKKSTNSNTVINYDLYHEDHPDWFSVNCSSSGYQWCYTARGNENELKALINEVALKIEFSMQVYDPANYPDLNVALIMMEDNFNTCTCPACQAAKAKYGADSGAVVVFMNRVAEIVEEWQNKPENAQYKRDDLKICFNAYNAFENSPTHYDEAKKQYIPNHPDVVMNERVGVYFAEINNLDNQQSFFCKDNEPGKAMFDGWAALTNWLELWVYETNFSNALYFYDSFAFSTQEFDNYIASRNVKLIFSQGIDNDGHTGWTGINWNTLKAYLSSKLTWDSTLNQEVLVNKWFEAMFKEAAPTMRKLFNLQRAHYNYLMDNFPNVKKLRSIYNAINKAEYYPLNTLLDFVSVVDEAKTYIEKYRTDTETYKLLSHGIEAEAVSSLYAILELHASFLTPNNKKEIVDRLNQDIIDLELSTAVVKEGGQTLSARMNTFN